MRGPHESRPRSDGPSRVTSYGSRAPREAPASPTGVVCRASAESLAAVTALLLDMGDVLYDATSWRLWLHHLLMQLGVRTDYASLFDVWDRQFLPDVHCGRVAYRDALSAFLRCCGLSGGQIDEVLGASAAKAHELETTRRPFPGVRSTLACLHQAGYALGVLSDSESRADELWARMRSLGIAPYLTAVVSSRDLGITKPHPAAYRRAAEALGRPVERIAFVGHDAEELEGAAAVGMRTVAFNCPPSVVADVWIARFDGLCAVFLPAMPVARAG